MGISGLHLDWGSSSYKGKVYRSYSLARALWKNGKNHKETIVKLGKLTELEVKKWRDLLNALKKPESFFTTFEDICVVRRHAYLDAAIVNSVWDEYGLDMVFPINSKKLISTAKIARILTINRSIEPLSKSKVPEWFNDTALPWMLDINPSEINPSRIFRELRAIENEKDAICQHLFNHFFKSDPASMQSLYYDLSSSSFEGTKCKLMKWGHCKGGYGNHVVLALVVNKSGLPFYWEVLPGGTADSTTIKWLLERLKNKFEHSNLKNITFVFDRGMVSDHNLDLLERDDIKYISAMDRNQIESITEFEFDQFADFIPEKIDEQVNQLSEFQNINKNTYAREIKIIGNRRYILCFNPQLFKDQRKAREQALADFKIFVNELNEELLEAKNSRMRPSTNNKFKKRLEKIKLNSFVEITLSTKHINKKENGICRKIRTYQGKVIVDEFKKRIAGKKDGFWLLVTNHSEKLGSAFKLNTEEAIAPYREKEIIEEAFKDIKSFVELEPVFVWTESHVKAHYTICVLSYLANRTLTLRLHKNEGKISKEIVAHAKLLKETSKCKLDYIEVKNIQQKKINLTKLTSKQRELLKRVKLSKILNQRIVEKANKNLNYAE